MLLIAIFVILIISFLWALYSLKRESSRPKEIQIAKKELMKEKVLFVKD